MESISTTGHLGHTRRVNIIAYAIGVPLVALLYCLIFLKLWGELFVLGDSPFPIKPPISLKVSVHVLGFPLLYLLNIGSVERMALRIVPGIEPLIFFTVLNGVFWGISIVSIGLLMYRRKHRST